MRVVVGSVLGALARVQGPGVWTRAQAGVLASIRANYVSVICVCAVFVVVCVPDVRAAVCGCMTAQHCQLPEFGQTCVCFAHYLLTGP